MDENKELECPGLPECLKYNEDEEKPCGWVSTNSCMIRKRKSIVEALEEICKKLASLPPEELEKLLDEHKDGEWAQIYQELHQFDEES